MKPTLTLCIFLCLLAGCERKETVSNVDGGFTVPYKVEFTPMKTDEITP